MNTLRFVFMRMTTNNGGLGKFSLRLLLRLLPHLPRVVVGIVVTIAFLRLLPLLIKSRLAQRLPWDDLVYLWPLRFVLGFAAFALRTRREGMMLGEQLKQRWNLEGGEKPLFSSYFSTPALLYLRAEDYSPLHRIRNRASRKNGVLGGAGLRMWLTDRWLMLQSQSANTWRIIPLPQIARVTESSPRSVFSYYRVVICYQHQAHSEILVLEDRSVLGPTLKEAPLAANVSVGS